MRKHRVVIVGGGFGGVKTALDLARYAAIDVTLLSDQPDFRYYPALYHTATGGLKAQSSIALTTIFHGSGVHLEYGSAEILDRTKKAVVTSDGRRFAYDTAVMALGSVTNYFGIPGMQDHSFTIKSLEGIEAFKAHVHEQFSATKRPDAHYVIVGAGPTGIELAGALPAYLHQIAARHGLKRTKINVDLIEAMPRLLPRSNPKVAQAVRERLHKLGVKVYVNQAVQGVTAGSLTLNGKSLASHTVIWTAGVANHPFYKQNSFGLNERGRVVVDEHLLAEKNVFVIGDNAATPFSGLAQTALADAEFVADTIGRRLDHRSLRAYKPKQPPTVIPVGANWAAIEWKRLHYCGSPAWLLRQAADWIGFHDIEPHLAAATKQWLTEFGLQEDCTVCATSRA